MISKCNLTSKYLYAACLYAACLNAYTLSYRYSPDAFCYENTVLLKENN